MASEGMRPGHNSNVYGFPSGLKSGGGGGTFDDMEARVTNLESQFDKLNDKVDQLRIDTAVLKEKVGNLPSKGFIVTATVSALALFSALVLFGQKIIALIG
ncbi:MAG: hypothetical protein H2046_05345 [Rhizobiales bacterium]|nr:hypothetical protein [Hyphomicrobiales bacterium]